MNKRTDPKTTAADAELFQAEVPPQGSTATFVSNGHEVLAVPAEDLRKIDQISVEMAAEQAAQAVAERARAAEAEDNFDWNNDDSVVLHAQRATAVYFNRHNGLVIRQEREWDEEADAFVVIERNNINSFLDRLTDIAGIPCLGKNNG